MANLKQAFEYASQNPDSDFAKNLEQLASSGSLDGEAKKYGIDLTPFRPAPTLASKLGQRAKDLYSEATLKPSRDILNQAQSGENKDLVATDSALRAAQSPIRAVGAVGGAIGDVFGAGLEAVGLDKVIGGAISPVVQSDPIQKALQVYQSLPKDTQEVLGSILNTANIPLGGAGVGVLKGGVESGIKATAETGAKVAKAVTPDASSIMQRVARIPKQKQIKFQNTAGESVGEYLTKRGVYGDEEQIVEQLYKRFTDSKKVADDALEQLSGTYKPQQVADALDMLEEKFTKSSTKGVKDPNLSRVEELIAKYNTEGLTMSEINEAKRIYEKNAKLDFARENNPDGIRLANNVDNSIREWQFNQAEQLGLKNLPEINRETRLARQLMDDLGAESAGIAGNNAVSLTDWIVLAEGNPASIAAFLGKKAAASKKIQSAVAKKVAGEPTVGQPEAIFTNAKKTTSLPEQKLLPESLPQSTPTTPKSKGINYERAEGLSPENTAIETKAFDKITSNEAELLAEYKKIHGKEINTDNFRPLFKDEGYNGANAAAVQEPSSYLAKLAFADALTNEGSIAMFSAGGSGVGKSFGIKSIPELSKLKDEAAVILDSNLSNYDSAIKKIKQAESAGKIFSGVYTYREPINALVSGVIKRMKSNPDEMGRIVPTKVIADNHINSLKVVKKLIEEGYDFNIIDNSIEGGKAMLTTLKAIESKAKYPSVKELTDIMNKKVKELYQKGELTPAQYKEYIN